MGVTVTPLTPHFGAELGGLDLANGFTDANFKAIRDAFTEYGLVVIRGHRLSVPDQVDLGRRFGEVQIHVMNQYRVDGHPEIYFLTNIGPDGKPTGAHPDQGTMYWHTDASWRPRTGHATIMVAEEVPKVGGETHFTCAATAYDAFSDADKAAFAKLRIVHNLDFSRTRRHGHEPMTDKQRAEAPPVTHPLVRTHPETGRKSLLLG
ncbi:MAG: TauD/TfdA family dioxygenase, partial [Rhodospirillaceae bacterium]